VGDAFSRSQRGWRGLRSSRGCRRQRGGLVRGVTIARWLRRSFSVIAPGWRGVILPSGSASGGCSGPTVPPYARAAASRGSSPSTADEKRGKRGPTPLHSKYRAHRGACGKTRVVPHYRRPKHQHLRNGRHEMRVLLSTYGSRGDVEPMVGLAVRSRVLGAEVRGCAPPDFAELLARAAGAGRPAVAPGGARGDGGRSVIRKAAGIEFPRVGSDDQPPDRRGRDGRGAGMGPTPRRARDPFREQHGEWGSLERRCDIL
jgi:hypothetical protein